MAIVQTATTSFKVELPQGIHNFGPTSPDTFKIALYTAAADLGYATTAYTTSGEVLQQHVLDWRYVHGPCGFDLQRH